MSFDLEVHISEEDGELLITLDDGGEGAREVDAFNHFQADNTLALCSGQPQSEVHGNEKPD